MSQTLNVRFFWQDQHEDLVLEYNPTHVEADESMAEMARDEFLDDQYDNWVDAHRGSWELDPVDFASERPSGEMFITSAITAGYHPSAAAQLLTEANPEGSYGLFMSGQPIPPVNLHTA